MSTRPAPGTPNAPRHESRTSAPHVVNVPANDVPQGAHSAPNASRSPMPAYAIRAHANPRANRSRTAANHNRTSLRTARAHASGRTIHTLKRRRVPVGMAPTLTVRHTAPGRITRRDLPIHATRQGAAQLPSVIPPSASGTRVPMNACRPTHARPRRPNGRGPKDVPDPSRRRHPPVSDPSDNPRTGPSLAAHFSSSRRPTVVPYTRIPLISGVCIRVFRALH